MKITLNAAEVQARLQGLVAAKAQYMKEMIPKVEKMQRAGFQFLLCWNYHRDIMTAWERAKTCKLERLSFDDVLTIQAVREAVRGIFRNETLGEEFLLIALNPGFTTTDPKTGRIYPTERAKRALAYLGAVPIKNHIKPQYFTTRGADRKEIVDYKFAYPEEVVAFM